MTNKLRLGPILFRKTGFETEVPRGQTPFHSRGLRLTEQFDSLANAVSTITPASAPETSVLVVRSPLLFWRVAM